MSYSLTAFPPLVGQVLTSCFPGRRCFFFFLILFRRNLLGCAGRPIIYSVLLLLYQHQQCFRVTAVAHHKVTAAPWHGAGPVSALTIASWSGRKRTGPLSCHGPSWKRGGLEILHMCHLTQRVVAPENSSLCDALT